MRNETVMCHRGTLIVTLFRPANKRMHPTMVWEIWKLKADSDSEGGQPAL